MQLGDWVQLVMRTLRWQRLSRLGEVLRKVGKHPWVGGKWHACHGHVHGQHGVRHADASVRHVHGQHRHMARHEAILQRFPPVQLLELRVLGCLSLRLGLRQASADLAAVSIQGSRRCW